MAKKIIDATNIDCINAAGITVKDLIQLVGKTDVADPMFIPAVAQAIKNLEARKREAVYRAAALRRSQNWLSKFRGSLKHALESYLSIDRTQGARGPSIEGRAQTIFGEASSYIARMMEHHRPKKLGWSYDRKGMKNLIRELRGTATGDNDAVAYARGYREAAEYLRQRANAAGANIGFLEDWGTPQYHESQRIGKVSMEEWREFIKTKLDVKRTFGEASADEVDKALDDIYRNVVTDGLWKMEPGQAGSAGLSVASQLGQPRELHFKNADAWIEYQELYGSEDLYGALLNHLERLARDIALVETLGPNPTWGYQYLRDLVRKDTGNWNSTDYADKIYNNLQGLPRGGNNWFADVMQSGRNILVASKLHSALFAAIPDIAYHRMTLQMNGLPVFKGLTRMVKQMNHWNKGDRILIARLGFIAEAALDRMVAIHRYTETTGVTFTAKLANTTMRLSGLQPWTVGNRRAFTLTMMNELAELSETTAWNDIHKNLRKSLESSGITPDDWETLRVSTKEVHNGVKYVNLMNLADQELRVRIGSLVNRELNYVSPTDSAAVRAITNQGIPAGTFVGEFWRSAFQFKGFAITQLITHLSRGVHNQAMNKAVYMGSLFATTTALAYLSIQAKQLLSGKDPRDLDPGMLVDMIKAGGFGGIAADTFLAMDDDYFRSFSQFFFGPVPTMVLDDFLLKTLWNDNLEALLEDTEEFLAGEYNETIAGNFVRLIRKYMPAVWQFKLFMERAIYDQLELMVDPDASDRMLRKMHTEQTLHNYDYYWEPGETSPHRGPEAPEIVLEG